MVIFTASAVGSAVVFASVIKQPLLTLVSAKTLKVITAMIANEDNFSRKEQEALIEMFFARNHNFILLKVQKAMDQAVAQLEDQIKCEAAELRACVKFGKFDRQVNTLREKMRQHLQSKDGHASFRRKEFLDACAANCPAVLLAQLHAAIIHHNSVQGNLLRDLIEAFDFPRYESCSGYIMLCAFTAIYCRLSYLSLTAVDPENAQQLPPQSVLDDICREKEEMTQKIMEIAKALTEHRVHAQSKIFRHPFAATSSPSTLQKLIEGHLRLNLFLGVPSSANHGLAKRIGQELEGKFPWYSWTVIIAEDSQARPTTITYSDHFKSDFFFLNSVVHKLVNLDSATANDSETTIFSEGNRFGLISCRNKVDIGYRSYARRINVFWCPPDAVKTLSQKEYDFVKEAANLKYLPNCPVKRICNHTATPENAAQVILENALRACKSEYVMFLTLSKRNSKEDVGIYPRAHTDRSDDPMSWPFCMKDDKGRHLFLWISDATPHSNALFARRNFPTLVDGLKSSWDFGVAPCTTVTLDPAKIEDELTDQLFLKTNGSSDQVHPTTEVLETMKKCSLQLLPQEEKFKTTEECIVQKLPKEEKPEKTEECIAQLLPKEEKPGEAIKSQQTVRRLVTLYENFLNRTYGSSGSELQDDCVLASLVPRENGAGDMRPYSNTWCDLEASAVSAPDVVTGHAERRNNGDPNMADSKIISKAQLHAEAQRKLKQLETEEKRLKVEKLRIGAEKLRWSAILDILEMSKEQLNPGYGTNGGIEDEGVIS